jgi:predicted nucleic acid-binding protein
MTGNAFVDTNLLVYRRDRSEPEKQAKANTWLTHLWNARAGRVSMQVLNEYYVTVTQKLKPGLDRKSARIEVSALFAWHPLPVERRTLEGAFGLQDRYGFSFWDSLIVSTALLSGSRYLLTEDLQDGQVVDGLTIVDPFVHEPDELP